MAKQVTPEHSYIGPRNVRPLANFNAAEYRDLRRLGIDITDKAIAQMIDGIGMDALTPSMTTGTIPTPIQFLQNWLPGFVNIITAARKIDKLIGITTAGSWEDEEIVQGLLEQLGTSVPYGDLTNVPLSSWNVSYNTRTVVRFEEGMRVGTLEEARASRMNVNTAQQKREAATLALEIQRNSIGFFGYNAGDNLTFGFLNDPNLPAYTVFANGAAASPLWSTKTFAEITRDIRTMVAQLRTQGQDLIDPKETDITLAIATSVIDFLSVTTDFGMSVQDWLTKTYPKIRVESAPELIGAHSGNAAIMYAEKISDMSTDDGRTWLQVVPTKFRTLGVQTLSKGYEEDYSNATAGVLCKRPFAVVRQFGN